MEEIQEWWNKLLKIYEKIWIKKLTNLFYQLLIILNIYIK